eukprot:10701758-Karenia_brevis.AAC.1
MTMTWVKRSILKTSLMRVSMRRLPILKSRQTFVLSLQMRSPVLMPAMHHQHSLRKVRCLMTAQFPLIHVVG